MILRVLWLGFVMLLVSLEISVHETKLLRVVKTKIYNWEHC